MPTIFCKSCGEAWDTSDETTGYFFRSAGDIKQGDYASPSDFSTVGIANYPEFTGDYWTGGDALSSLWRFNPDGDYVVEVVPFGLLGLDVGALLIEGFTDISDFDMTFCPQCADVEKMKPLDELMGRGEEKLRQRWKYDRETATSGGADVVHGGD